MKKQQITIRLLPRERDRFEEVCEFLKISKSDFIRICSEFIYKKAIKKEEWPLLGLTEKYHITSESLGIITNTCYKDIDYAVMDEFYKGDKDNGK
jgi:hypothetical protein